MHFSHFQFSIEPLFEHDTHHQKARIKMLMLHNKRGMHDRRAQRAIWEVKLRILEARQSILEKEKIEMLSKMRSEFKTMMEQRSDLGTGYAEYEFPPLA